MEKDDDFTFWEELMRSFPMMDLNTLNRINDIKKRHCIEINDLNSYIIMNKDRRDMLIEKSKIRGLLHKVEYDLKHNGSFECWEDGMDWLIKELDI